MNALYILVLILLMGGLVLIFGRDWVWKIDSRSEAHKQDARQFDSNRSVGSKSSIARYCYGRGRDYSGSAHQCSTVNIKEVECLCDSSTSWVAICYMNC